MLIGMIAMDTLEALSTHVKGVLSNKQVHSLKDRKERRKVTWM